MEELVELICKLIETKSHYNNFKCHKDTIKFNMNTVFNTYQIESYIHWNNNILKINNEIIYLTKSQWNYIRETLKHEGKKVTKDREKALIENIKMDLENDLCGLV